MGVGPEHARTTADAARHTADTDPSGSWPAPVGLTGLPRPLLADRQCSRSGCADRAAASLTYHYGQSQVWLDDLAHERDPHSYDICDRHAAGLSVPRGWHLDDRRFRRGLIAV